MTRLPPTPFLGVLAAGWLAAVGPGGHAAAAADAWPRGDWQTATAGESLANPEGIRRLRTFAFTRIGTDAEQKGVRTDGLLIIRGGKIQYEEYHDKAKGGVWDAKRPHLIWSATKSFANTLAGIALKEKRIALETPVANWYPELAGKSKKPLTVGDVLEMSSCLKWNEAYEGSGPAYSSVYAMLYIKGFKDTAKFVAGKDFHCDPGSTWYYSSGDSNLLMGILKKAFGQEKDTFPWSRLFEPLGISNGTDDVTFEQDASGTFIGSSYLYATPRQLARFGYLYLKDGRWDVKQADGSYKVTQLLPARLVDANGQEDASRCRTDGHACSWAEYSGRPVPAMASTPLSDRKESWQGGPQFWVNAPLAKPGLDDKGYPYGAPLFSAAPDDMYWASGHWGQYVFVIPSLDLVIVRVGDDRNTGMTAHQFLNDLLYFTVTSVLKGDELDAYKARLDKLAATKDAAGNVIGANIVPAHHLSLYNDLRRTAR